MQLSKHKIINLFHLLIVFPLIIFVIYKDYFVNINPDLVKNILRVVVTIGIINHAYQFINVD